jgi:hypothetical protein
MSCPSHHPWFNHPNNNLVKCTSYEAAHYAVFSSLPLCPPSWVQIFSSAPYIKTLSIYAPPLVWETTFHTHTKEEVKLWVRVF